MRAVKIAAGLAALTIFALVLKIFLYVAPLPKDGWDTVTLMRAICDPRRYGRGESYEAQTRGWAMSALGVRVTQMDGELKTLLEAPVVCDWPGAEDSLIETREQIISESAPKAFTHLMRIVAESPSPYARYLAVNSMSKPTFLVRVTEENRTAVRAALEARLRDESPKVRAAAQQALVRLVGTGAAVVLNPADASAAPADAAVSQEAERASRQHYLSGMTYYQKGDWEKARGEWKEALRLNRKNQDAKEALLHKR